MEGLHVLDRRAGSKPDESQRVKAGETLCRGSAWSLGEHMFMRCMGRGGPRGASGRRLPANPPEKPDIDYRWEGVGGMGEGATA